MTPPPGIGLIRRRVLSFLQLTAVLSVSLLPALAQGPVPKSAGPSVRVHGSVTIQIEPDQAQFDIGVVTQAATAKSAADQNALQSNALLQELGKAFPEAGTKAVNFSVNPNYEYPREGAARIAGYTANNTLRLLLNDLSKLQAVIDVAVRSGAQSINRLSFTVRDENSARARALAAAARQAQVSAEALAASLNLRLTSLLTVEEGQPVIVSAPRDFSFEKLQSTSLAPLALGTIDVHADVDLTYAALPTAPQKKVPSQ